MLYGVVEHLLLLLYFFIELPRIGIKVSGKTNHYHGMCMVQIVLYRVLHLHHKVATLAVRSTNSQTCSI